MKIYYLPRVAGKTTQIIKDCAKERGNAVIVTVNSIRAQMIFARAKELKLRIPYPITMFDFINKRYYGRHIDNFLFDDLDACLQSLTAVNIKAATITNYEETASGKTINADELKKLFPDNGEGAWTYNITAKMYIDNAPAVEERPTGKWHARRNKYYSGGGYYFCNKCNQRFSFGAYFELNNENFCPHCGAKMKTEGLTDDQ